MSRGTASARRTPEPFRDDVDQPPLRREALRAAGGRVAGVSCAFRNDFRVWKSRELSGCEEGPGTPVYVSSVFGVFETYQ